MPREIPYRGDDDPRNNKPRRRFRNMKLERRETAISIFVILIIGLIAFSGIALNLTTDGNNAIKSGGLVIVTFFVVTLIAGILSANKFRKGYDVDISEESEREKDKQSKDSND